MSDIDFNTIAPRSGSQQNAFEELCCQLAAKACPAGSVFERFRGAGGDGGVECVAQLADKTIVGWQAKFVFDVEGLITQASKSLATASKIYPSLAKYIVCFPFDPTGPTGRGLAKKRGRPAKSGSEKLKEWMEQEVAAAKAAGRSLVIELWPAHFLQSHLVANDRSGGIRHYFFSAETLSNEWFKAHVESALVKAGPRYSPALSLDTPLSQWFAAFDGGTEWQSKLRALLKNCRNAIVRLDERVASVGGDTIIPKWATGAAQAGTDAAAACKKAAEKGDALLTDPSSGALSEVLASIDAAQRALAEAERLLVDDFEAVHGKGQADNKKFRSYMAEYEVSFPTANIDTVRETMEALRALYDWLRSPPGFLACNKTFVLTGRGGSGKTHGVCAVASKRLKEGKYTCIVFGHQFGGEPDPWTRLAESLGLPTTLGKNRLLDALNAAGEASGRPLIVCIDAVNETTPRNYWQGRYDEVALEFEKRPHLKLCVSCRSSFLAACLPGSATGKAIEHEGFAGMERDACNVFFQYYGLEPPLVPVLQSELSNPLYLKLVCQTLQKKGLKRLPAGWLGLSPVINAFLHTKEEDFSRDHDVSAGAAIVSGSLAALATAIADSGNSSISWSEAQLVVDAKKPQSKGMRVIDWLIKADLLIEDGPSGDAAGGESVVRPAFERLGDFLIAGEILGGAAPIALESAFASTSKAAKLWSSHAAVVGNAGVLAALSVLVAERNQKVELPDFIEDPPIRQIVANMTIRALPWRTPASFCARTESLVQDSLNGKAAGDTVDALLAVATLPSRIDAYWIDGLLNSQPMAKRDAFWCRYLRDRYENGGVVKRLINAASDFDLSKVDNPTAERWTVMLLWFTAAADRRVKDWATRSATALMRAKPEMIAALVDRFLGTDDDEVRERVLLCAYGALLITRDATAVKTVTEILFKAYIHEFVRFQNAIIRDNIRCIWELAAHLGVLDPKFDPMLTSVRVSSVPQPVDPTEAEVKQWGDDEDPGARSVVRSTLYDDFNHYSINCLSRWFYFMGNKAVGRWIAKHVLKDFGYLGTRCGSYDEMVTRQTGGGRDKPKWAERIGKKYQWLSMYQLASQLYDSVDRKVESWDSVPSVVPLILVEERKLDPTISQPTKPKTEGPAWWCLSGQGYAPSEQEDFAKWIEAAEDIPALETLLTVTEHSGQQWLPLTLYPHWSDRPSDDANKEPYRFAWIHLTGYLVPNAMFDEARRVLGGRNFFGDWMPRGAKWLYAFVGEYPWGTACNTDSDEWRGFGEKAKGSAVKLIPVANEVVAEWEYDASLPESIYFEVPARTFFADGGLWWDGWDGFRTKDRTVFRDPSATSGGPAGLIADIDHLQTKLKEGGFRLIWTMLGEKVIHNDDHNVFPRRTYSQIGFLNEDGTIGVGPRRFFADFDTDTGPGP